VLDVLEKASVGHYGQALELLESMTESFGETLKDATLQPILLGLMGTMKDKLGHGGARRWGQATDLLRATGMALPPELSPIKPPSAQSERTSIS